MSQLFDENELDLLTGAYDISANDSYETILENTPGKDFSKIFFEPAIGKNYTIKFLPNLGMVPPHLGKRANIGRTQIYNRLPDPFRKGKTFHYISSGIANGEWNCKVLDLFFKIHKKEKNEGSLLAEQIRKRFLGKTSVQICYIQVIATDDEKIEVGSIRLFKFGDYADSKIANMVKEKINPEPELIANGIKPEDIFNLFDTSALFFKCIPKQIPDLKEPVRDYSALKWFPNKSAMLKIDVEENGVIVQKFRPFSNNDLMPDKKVKPECLEYVKKFTEMLKDPEIDMFLNTGYKHPKMANLPESTQKYVNELYSKIDAIIPIIENAKSIEEILELVGANEVIVNSNENENEKKVNGKSDIHERALPDLLNKNLNFIEDDINVDNKKITKSVPSVVDILSNIDDDL